MGECEMSDDSRSYPKTVCLTFEGKDAFEYVDDAIHKDLSAATRHGEVLFLSCDETAGVDRLTPQDDGNYGQHMHYALGDLTELPDGPSGEMDIEGLEVDGDWLWIVGSHSLKRNKPDKSDDPAQALKAMVQIEWDPNRAFLARVPLIEDDGGLRPAAEDGERRLNHIKLHRKKSKLKSWLRDDPHIGPFLDLPSKENGFDIEGIAAKELRVWLGLRGPVLRQMAVVIELQFKITKRGYLKARRIDGKRRYRKHLLPAHGQGIRDLAFDNEDILLLTGPTTAGDGVAELLRWRDAISANDSGVVPNDRVERLRHLPYRGRYDHPEGLVRWMNHSEWLVVYDSPAPERLQERPARVTADIWKI